MKGGDIMSSETLAAYIIGGIFLFILLLLFIRELNCWYWKINEHLMLMYKHLMLMREIRDLLKTSQAGAMIGSRVIQQKNEIKGSEIKCLKCGKSFVPDWRTKYCKYCGEEMIPEL